MHGQPLGQPLDNHGQPRALDPHVRVVGKRGDVIAARLARLARRRRMRCRLARMRGCRGVLPLCLSASLYCSDGVASHHAENLPTKCRESASVLGSPFFNGSAYISGHCRQCRESDLHFARACTCALLEFYRTFQPPLTRK